MATVVEEKEKDILLINGQPYEGFVDDNGCKKCSELRIYSYEYDAFFCAGCNEWLEPACSDAACAYCRNRPPTPLHPKEH